MHELTTDEIPVAPRLVRCEAETIQMLRIPPVPDPGLIFVAPLEEDETPTEELPRVAPAGRRVDWLYRVWLAYILVALAFTAACLVGHQMAGWLLGLVAAVAGCAVHGAAWPR